MSKWTPEPWYGDREPGRDKINGYEHLTWEVHNVDAGVCIVILPVESDTPANRAERMQTTARITTAVNACTGLNPAAIPALVEAAARWEKATQPLIITDEPKVATYNHSEFVAACRELRAALAAVKGTLTRPAASGEKGGG